MVRPCIHGEQGYLWLLREILDSGTEKTDRTGVGTYSLFGAQLRFDLQEGFPLLTTKSVFSRGVFGELIWLLSGDTNIRFLQENGIHIWDEWANENGDLGPVYGKQWRAWKGNPYAIKRGDHDEYNVLQYSIDQLSDAIDQIKTNPDSRRIIVTAWNPSDIPDMKLPPCHMMYQFEVHDGKLSCHMYQRSADMFLGVPFNIASYAALTHVIARLTSLEVGDLIISFGDVHIYKNHCDQVLEQLQRKPRDLPTLVVDPALRSLDDLKFSSFVLSGYSPHPAIKAEVAV